MASGTRNVAATVVGWAIVVVIAWLLFGSLVSTLRWLLRMAVIVGLIVVLLWLWFRLKAGPDDD